MQEMYVPLRPCLVGNRKHLFHQWQVRAWVVEPGIMVGSTPGGQCSVTTAIVEDEYGQVREVQPREIRFLDNRIEDYDFGDEPDQLTMKGMGND